MAGWPCPRPSQSSSFRWAHPFISEVLKRFVFFQASGSPLLLILPWQRGGLFSFAGARWINSVKRHCCPLPPLQIYSLIVDDSVRATAFNEFFQSVFTEERLSDMDSLHSSLGHQLQIQSLYILLIISINNIINCSKACGPDLIPPSLLLLTFVFLFLNYLTSLCYQENYLRIGSLLKFVLCSRKVTHVSQAATNQLVLRLLLSKWWGGLFGGSALSDSCRFSDYQHGFRPNHSIISLLLTVIYDWALCLERWSTTHCIF